MLAIFHVRFSAMAGMDPGNEKQMSMIVATKVILRFSDLASAEKSVKKWTQFFSECKLGMRSSKFVFYCFCHYNIFVCKASTEKGWKATKVLKNGQFENQLRSPKQTWTRTELSNDQKNSKKLPQLPVHWSKTCNFEEWWSVGRREIWNIFVVNLLCWPREKIQTFPTSHRCQTWTESLLQWPELQN